MLITAGQTPSIFWQLLAYIILTSAEILVSVTALEMAYTQAPNSLKSFIMSFYLLSVALGNFVTAMVNFGNEYTLTDGSTGLYLEGADYYWFFTALAFVSTFILWYMSARYKEQMFVQTEDMRE